MGKEPDCQTCPACEERAWTAVPGITLSKSSATSWFSMRMQPEETTLPTVCCSLVPWIR